MGMFDDLICKYPLPVPGANELRYQTKDTPEQHCDLYEIREDGTLWREAYDTEDHSEQAKWIAANPGKEVPEEMKTFQKSFFGCMARVNQRWIQVPDFAGELNFYTSIGDGHTGWIEFTAQFEAGKVVSMKLMEHRPLDAAADAAAVAAKQEQLAKIFGEPVPPSIAKNMIPLK